MDIFEIITEALRNVHDGKNLEDVSNLYSKLYAENNQMVDILDKTLVGEDLKVFHYLCDNFSYREVTAEDIYYNQGFSDAIKLIVQSMLWSPVRR
ncbi:hypothetical protein SAMN05660742_10476 [Propionispira arboris]|uniref:Uncharacterized protein n=1 Tax=Propionispira arboris TaxID=84035 RepID=A0A1H6WRB6_9FIRM|nr:hypothetical protein [Propionispira arboris]SEJ18336.1 hypothetical protein SAMN05660742_10476 [Propionispira arboris]